jgi:hypothetical protein
VVDPCLESRGYRKVVHRGCKNDLVGFENLGNQLIRKSERFLVIFVVVFRRRERPGDPVHINKSERGFGQIPLDDAPSGILVFPGLNSRLAQTAGDRVSSTLPQFVPAISDQSVSEFIRLN